MKIGAFNLPLTKWEKGRYFDICNYFAQYAYHNVLVTEAAWRLAQWFMPLDIIHINKCLFIKFASFLNWELVESLLSTFHASFYIHLQEPCQFYHAMSGENNK